MLGLFVFFFNSPLGALWGVVVRGVHKKKSVAISLSRQSARWPRHPLRSVATPLLALLLVATAATSLVAATPPPRAMPGPSPSAAAHAAEGQFAERFDTELSDIRGHYEVYVGRGDGRAAADLVGAVEALAANVTPRPLFSAVATSPPPAADVATSAPAAAAAAAGVAPSKPPAPGRGSAARRATSRHNKQEKDFFMFL